MKRALLMIPAVLIAGAALAAGQATHTDKGPMQHANHGNGMSKLDTNKDGKLSKAEAAANPRLAAAFDKRDVNKDGYIDATDRAAMKKQFEAKRAERQKQHFAEVDSNKDGKLSKEEMRAFHQRKQAERAQKQAAGMDEMFKRMDTNKDGFISQDEMKAGHQGAEGRMGKHRGWQGHQGMTPPPPPAKK